MPAWNPEGYKDSQKRSNGWAGENRTKDPKIFQEQCWWESLSCELESQEGVSTSSFGSRVDASDNEVPDGAVGVGAKESSKRPPQKRIQTLNIG